MSLTLNKFVGESGSDVEMTYEPGKESVFRVVLENNNEAFVAGVELKDLLNSMTVSTVKGTTERAFESWSIEVKQSNPLTTITPSPSGNNKQIDATINIAPNDTIEFLIRGVVNPYANGEIINKASMSINSSRPQRVSVSAKLLPEPDKVIITKVADNPIYVAGQESTFRIRLFNDSKGFANDVVLRDTMSRILVPTRPDIATGNREVVPAFTQWSIDVTQSDPRTIVTAPTLGPNADIDALIDIAPGDTVEFAITGTVDARAMGEIVNTAHKIDEAPQSSGNQTAPASARTATVESVSAMITPEAVKFLVNKTTDKGENATYGNDDQELVYQLQVTNEGSALISGVKLVDEISKLMGENGNTLFTSWQTTITEWPTGEVKAKFDDQDLLLPEGGTSLDLLPYMGNGYDIKIVGQLNKGLDDNITNVFTVTDPATGTSASDDVTIYIKKFADNEGELLVTKEALKSEAQVGEVVEYEVIISNPNESEFKNVKLVDKYPAGFAYVEGSTEITNSGLMVSLIPAMMCCKPQSLP